MCRVQGVWDGVAVDAADMQNGLFSRNFRRRHTYSDTCLDGETTWFGLLRVVFIDFGTLSFDLVGQNFHTSISRCVAPGCTYLLTLPALVHSPSFSLIL